MRASVLLILGLFLAGCRHERQPYLADPLLVQRSPLTGEATPEPIHLPPRGDPLPPPRPEVVRPGERLARQ